MGIRTLAIYSKEDTLGLFRTKADEAYLIGENRSPLGAYLAIDEIIPLAKRRKVEAIHPGYGLLSENAKFVSLCEKCNIAFIGPTSQMISQMGDKDMARKTMRNAGVPVTPGCDIITDIGEGGLCQICADHPRFRADFSDRIAEASAWYRLRTRLKTPFILLPARLRAPLETAPVIWKNT